MSAEPTHREPRVLVVDGEENITFLLEAAMAHIGFDVRVAMTEVDARAVEPDRPIALSAQPVTVAGDKMSLVGDRFDVTGRGEQTAVWGG